MNIISGVKFTLREVDVIACVLHHRGNKRTADILSISYRTVEVHIRNIIGKINKATRDDIIDFIEKSQVSAHIKTYYTWVLISYYFKNCLLKIARINQQELHYAIIDKMSVTEDQSYRLLTEKLQNIQKDLQLANVILTVKKSTTDHYFTLEPEGTKASHKKIVIVFDNNNNKDTSEVIYIDFRGNYYLSILNLLETIIPKAEVKKIIQEFKDQYFNLQGVTNIASDAEQHANKRVFIKYLIAALVIVIMALAVIFFFQKRDKLSPEPNIHNSSHKLPVEKISQTWDLPYFKLAHYVNRNEIIKTVTDKLTQAQNVNKPTVFVGLYGLAGIGKTTLAKYLIHHPVKKYDFKGWFNAENDDLLKSSYISLGEKHHLFSQEVSEHQKIDKTKAWLNSQEDLLIVYDNAPDATILKKYLPDHGHIIITSRNYKVPGALALETMTQQESATLLSNLIPKKIMENQQAVDALVKTMGCLPLALSQAGAYIADNQIIIADYLNFYRHARKKVLSDKTLPAMEEHEPIYIAWNLTIQALRQKSNQEKIFQLLGFIGQCYREKIPKKLLSQYLFNSTDGDAMVELNTVLKSLTEYSLVKIYENTIAIHPLIHSFVQDLFTDQVIEVDIVKKAIESIIAFKSSLDIKLKDNFVKMLSPHVESIFSKAKNILKEQEYTKLTVFLGHSYYHLGDYKMSQKLLIRALDIQTQQAGNDCVENGLILYYLGKVEIQFGNYDKSQEHLTRSLEIQKKHYGADNIKTNPTLIQLAKLECTIGNYNACKDMLKKALYIQNQYADKNKPVDLNKIEILFLLGANELLLGNYEKSKKLLQQVSNLEAQHYDKNHVLTAPALYYLARVEMELGNYQESINLLKKVLTIENQYYGIDHPETIFTLHYLGRAEAMVGNYKTSKELLEQSLKFQEKYFGINHVKVADTLNSLGLLYMKIGKHQDSQQVLERALQIQEKSLDSNHIKVADTLYVLGELHSKTGNHQAAKKFLERALKIHKKYFGADHKKVKRTMDALDVLVQA